MKTASCPLLALRSRTGPVCTLLGGFGVPCRMIRMISLFSTIALSVAASAQPAAPTVTHLDEPPTAMTNSHYISNREPLEPSRLIKLPIGSIRPEGWLEHQLRLQADGFHGHLEEISPFLQQKGNAWLDPKGRGERGWEEVPYWLKGYLNCAYVLGDRKMIAEAQKWIDGAINSQQDDGWFGPDEGRSGLATRLKGREDLWPNMIMLFCLMDYEQATHDERVIRLMDRYFRYLHKLPEDRFLIGYWPKMRGGDQLAAIHWLYNRTGEAWLLDLAEKTHRHTARWDEGIINWHNVNIAQGFREPTQWWVQSHEQADRSGAERDWEQIRSMYGQVPGGMFGADENARKGFTDPRQCIETCGIVEAMLSDEMLLGITGEMIWADRCEDIAFNALPAAFTADMGALRYLSAPNQPVSDAENHAPGIQNGGAMFLMSPHRHRCCQHNAGHGWPYFAEHLWYATPDNGLAAVLFSPSTVQATVGAGAGTAVTVREETSYPFQDSIRFTVQVSRSDTFPLYFRIPGWCDAARIEINGQAVDRNPPAGQLVRIERTWNDGDIIDLHLPMNVTVRTWEDNHGFVSVDRGPLTYSLDIGERMHRVDDAGAQNKQLPDAQKAALNKQWPAYEILPTTDWNYALSFQGPPGPDNISVHLRAFAENQSPWTPQTVPVVLTADARKVPQWTLDAYGLAAPLQDSPVFTDQPEQQVKLIPMGAARIRITAFPVASSDADANIWTEPRKTRTLYHATASHVYESDSIDAVADGIDPSSSDDDSIARLTFWPHTGTQEWVQASFDKPRTITGVAVYWFDDTGSGRCRVPASWSVSALEGEKWVTLATGDEFGVKKDQFNSVSFEAIETNAVRLNVQLQEGFSGGVLEWRID